MIPCTYIRSSTRFGVTIIALLCVFSCGRQNEQTNPSQQESPSTADRLLSEKVEAVVLKKIELITHRIASHPTVIKAVKESNQVNQHLTLSDIEKLDAHWIGSTAVNDQINKFVVNDSAKLLQELQKTSHGFSEIFITDAKGLNVAMTNKTSDYYQADEDWWVDTFNGGRGKSYYGSIEYDESAMAEAVPLYIPIKDETNTAIGVIKAVVDLGVIKKEL